MTRDAYEDALNMYRNQGTMSEADRRKERGQDVQEGWSCMGVEGHTIKDGETTMRVLPQKPEYLVKRDPTPYVEVVYHMISVLEKGVARNVMVLSLTNFFGKNALDPIALERKRCMWKLPDKESRREFINQPANEWLGEKSKYMLFFLLGRSDATNNLMPLTPEDLRITSVPTTVQKMMDLVPCHERKPVLYYHPQKGTDLFVKRWQEGGETRNKKYALDWEKETYPIFDDPYAIDPFLDRLPDIKKYITLEYHLTSPIDCRVFNVEQLGKLMRAQLTVEQAVQENVENHKKGIPLISDKQWQWMNEYNMRLRNKNFEPFPYSRWGVVQVQVPSAPLAPPPPPAPPEDEEASSAQFQAPPPSRTPAPSPSALSSPNYAPTRSRRGVPDMPPPPPSRSPSYAPPPPPDADDDADVPF